MKNSLRIIFSIFLMSIMGVATAAPDKIEDWRDHAPSMEEAELLPEVLKYIGRSYPQHMDKILAVRLGGFKGDPYEVDALGRYMRYQLYIQVAFQTDEKSGHAFVVQGECLTTEARQGPPFKYCSLPKSFERSDLVEGGFFHWFTPLDQLPDQSKYGVGGSAGGSSMLSHLLLAGALLCSGLLLAGPLLQSKLPQLKPLYDVLNPIKPAIGVATLGIGSALLFTNLLSPLSNILPQLMAIIVGLYLGMDILVRRKEGALAAVAGDNANAQKVGQGADQAIASAQALLDRNKEKIDKLSAYQVPLGVACLVLAMLHLFAGGALFI